MTDARERVARAIATADLGDMVDLLENQHGRYFTMADAALSAIGWREMVEALETANKELSAFLSADDHAMDGLHLAYGSVMAALSRARGEKT